MTARRLAALLGCLLVAFFGSPAAAQNLGLEKTDKGFKHPASGTEFRVPDKWQVLPPKPLPNGVGLGINYPDQRIAVTVYWVQLDMTLLSEYIRVKPDGPTKTFGREHEALKRLYGADKVGKPEELKLAGRTVYRIQVTDGPDKDGAMAGALYVWEAGPNDRDRWLIKLRASYPKKDQAEHAKTVEGLVKNFK